MASKRKVVKKGKKQRKSSISTKKSSYYKQDGSKIIRSRTSCPKCGPGIFMADHKDRMHCGRCGYSQFKKSV